MSLYTYPLDYARDEYIDFLLSNRYTSSDLYFTSLQARRASFLRKHIPFRAHAGVDYYDVNALLSIHISKDQSATPQDNTSDASSSPLQRLIEQAANIDQVHRLQRNWEFGQCIDGGGCSDEMQLYPFTTLDDFDQDALPFIEGFPSCESRIARIILSEFERLDCCPPPPDSTTKFCYVEETNTELIRPGRMYDFFRFDDESYNIWFVQRGNFTSELQYTMYQNQYPCYSVIELIQLFAELPLFADAMHLYKKLLTEKIMQLGTSQHIFGIEKAKQHHQIRLGTFLTKFLPLMNNFVV